MAREVKSIVARSAVSAVAVIGRRLLLVCRSLEDKRWDVCAEKSREAQEVAYSCAAARLLRGRNLNLSRLNIRQHQATGALSARCYTRRAG